MKLINDTLKNAKGKWSRKSITALVSLTFALNYATTIPYIWQLITDTQFNFNVTVFSMSLTLCSVCLGLSVWDKSNGGYKQQEINPSINNPKPKLDDCEDGSCYTKEPEV